jgi:6-phosphogluconolactonase
MEQKPQIIVAENLSGLSRIGAYIFAAGAKDAVVKRGCFRVAISGGAGPRPMHRLLAREPYLLEIPWSETHIFWVDERCVPVGDLASNYGEALKDFIDDVPIPHNHVHNMPVDFPPEEGALRYEQDLLKIFQFKSGEFPVFDLIFIGIGIDGHTASLFPESRALEEKDRLILSVEGGDPNVHRLTMTLPVLNNARKIIFFVSGKGKAEILHQLFLQGRKRLPAQMIRPRKGELIWLLDRDSASLLT